MRQSHVSSHFYSVFVSAQRHMKLNRSPRLPSATRSRIQSPKRRAPRPNPKTKRRRRRQPAQRRTPSRSAAHLVVIVSMYQLVMLVVLLLLMVVVTMVRAEQPVLLGLVGERCHQLMQLRSGPTSSFQEKAAAASRRPLPATAAALDYDIPRNGGASRRRHFTKTER